MARSISSRVTDRGGAIRKQFAYSPERTMFIDRPRAHIADLLVGVLQLLQAGQEVLAAVAGALDESLLLDRRASHRSSSKQGPLPPLVHRGGEFASSRERRFQGESGSHRNRG